jgi:hypothetical protein
MEVVYFAPGKAIRMLGGLGPLQEMGVHGALTIRLRPDGNKTVILLTYDVSGFFAGGTDKIAPAVDGVLIEQMDRLKAFTEKGNER